jgi:hypothetical protein
MFPMGKYLIPLVTMHEFLTGERVQEHKALFGEFEIGKWQWHDQMPPKFLTQEKVLPTRPWIDLEASRRQV